MKSFVKKITPEKITKLDEMQVFVFGSNLAGRHGAGAAKLAKDKFGAKYGISEGLMGQSYALPTKDAFLKTLELDRIEWHIGKLLDCAEENPLLEFLVTEVGCGLAGLHPRVVAPLFFKWMQEIPENVSLPMRFWRYQPDHR